MRGSLLVLFLGLLTLSGCAPAYRDISGDSPKLPYRTADEVWYTNWACFDGPLPGCRIHPSSRLFYSR